MIKSKYRDAYVCNFPGLYFYKKYIYIVKINKDCDVKINILKKQ